MSEQDRCPICNHYLSQGIIKNPNGFDENEYNCSVCGKFKITRTAIQTTLHRIADDDEKRAILCHNIRKQRYPTIDSDTLEALEHQSLPNPPEQAANLILWLGNNTNSGEYKELPYICICAIAGTLLSDEHSSWLIKELVVKGLLLKRGATSRNTTLALSFDGWEYYEQLKKTGVHTKKAFMAMPFEDTDEVGLGEMLKKFKESVKDTGFRLIRTDDLDVQKAGLIDDQMRVEIRNSGFVVVDLTYGNQGAYWEAGFAQGLDKKVFYTCSKEWFEKEKGKGKKGIHFDTEHEYIIFWDKNNLEEVAKKLKYAIRNSLPDVAKMEDHE